MTTLRLKVGGIYLDREGRRRGPLEALAESSPYYRRGFRFTYQGAEWRPDGTFLSFPCRSDLISEAPPEAQGEEANNGISREGASGTAREARAALASATGSQKEVGK